MSQSSDNDAVSVSAPTSAESPPALSSGGDATGSVQQGGGGDEPPPRDPDNVIDIGGEGWKQLLLRDGKGRLRESSLENAILFLEHEYPGYFAWNEFADEVYMIACPVWGNARTFKAKRISNDDIIRMTALLERKGLAPSTSRTRDAINTVARKSSFHPAREYFNKLEWDKVPRLKKWLAYYLGSEQHHDYLATIGTMWLVAAVRRTYHPGTKFDHMLVLEGKTNKGKSTALRTLATFGRDEPEDYFCDSVALDEINEKSSTALLQGRLIVEFQELDGMSKKTDEALKRWITLQSDEVQKKYENATTIYPRQFVLSGTTNEDTWLRDPTGNRRYWPVRVGNIDMAALNQDKEQLWAEAVHLHKQGHKIWLADDDPVYHLAQREQSARIVTDAWTGPIMRLLKLRNSTTIEDVLKELIPETARHDGVAQRRVASVLRLNGWTSTQKRQPGEKNPLRVWQRDDKQRELNFDEKEGE